jgi:YggT family protein
MLLLDDITEPLLAPLRRVIPRLGIFDLSPLVAIGILYLIPFIFSLLLT